MFQQVDELKTGDGGGKMSPTRTSFVRRPRADYLIACGLIGEPVPPVMTSGGPQKKNS
jgi:hypothetical protein